VNNIDNNPVYPEYESIDIIIDNNFVAIILSGIALLRIIELRIS
jgi:hypothetical protein